MTPIKVVFQTSYFPGFWESLKFATLYFDEVILLDASVSWIKLTEELVKRGMLKVGQEFKIPETAACWNAITLPLTVRKSIAPYIDEGLFKIIKLPSIGSEPSPFWSSKEVLGRFNSIFYDLHGDEITIIDPKKDNYISQLCSTMDSNVDEYDIKDYAAMFAFLSAVSVHSMSEFSLPLLTDCPIIESMIFHVFNTCFEKELLENKFSLKQDIKKLFVAEEVIRSELPLLNLLSFDDVLEARNYLKEELVFFRSSIATLSTELSSNPWNKDFKQQVEEQYITKILPSIKLLERKLQTSRDKFILRAVRNLRSPKAYVPLLASIFTNIPLAALILASTGIQITEAALETYFERKELIETNGLGFLIKFRDRYNFH